jgi:RHS repeat-associated protein
MKLHYAGDRVNGYHYGITVPVSGDTVPDSLKRIEVCASIAGKWFMQVLDPLPNQQVEFVWDGLDWRGHPVTYPTTARVIVNFVYNMVYFVPSYVGQAFGKTGTDATTIESRQERYLGKRYYLSINPKSHLGGNGVVAEGWALSHHHYLSPVDPSILNKGDGSTVKSVNSEYKSRSVLYSGMIDTITSLFYEPSGVTADAEGNFYIADSRCIQKMDNDGNLSTVAGDGSYGFDGDGGPAIDAMFRNPTDVAVDSMGNLYIADKGNHRIRKVDTAGIITTIAGGGTAESEENIENSVPRIAIVVPDPDDPSPDDPPPEDPWGFSGDDGPATQAKLYCPTDVAVDSWGNLYIADSKNYRIRKVDADGIITTVVGNGTAGYSGDGGPAIDAQIGHPGDIAVDSEGNLYIMDTDNYRVRKVNLTGIITTVAGNGTAGYSGDEGPATEARIGYSEGITVDSEGNMYIADMNNHTIRGVDKNGIITTVAGTGRQGYSGDGGAATRARLSNPHDLVMSPAGDLFIANDHRIRKVGPRIAFIDLKGISGKVFVEDNGTGHVVSSAGRHMKTIDLDNGVTLNEFGYDEDSNLVSITDRFGGQTRILRDGDGIPTSIVSPDGIVTYLTVNADNHLTRVAYADGGYHSFEYTPDGLLRAKVEPEGNRFEHQFNELGRLTDATDDEGGHWHYERIAFENGDILTEKTTGEGNRTSYLDHTYSTGRYLSTITDPTGAQTLYERSADGLIVNKNLSCGMYFSFTYDTDPEYRFKYISEMEETTPASRQRVTERNKTYLDTDSDEMPDFITETVTVNGKTTTLEHDILQSKKIVTSPEGRTVTSYYHPENLLTTRLDIPGLYDTTYGYDTRGRITSLITNARETAYSYNAMGFLESVTDPENHTTTYSYDPVGRITGVSRPDGSSVGFTYDRNGNMMVLSTPSNIDHQFGYNRVNYNSSYVSPISGGYSYVYDRDRRLKQIIFPSGNRINNIYDKTRLVQIQTPEGNIDFNYLCSTKVDSITNGSDTITYGYDGKLVTSETSSGTLNTTLLYSYDNDFNISSFTYGGNTESYTYDNDGLLTGAGRFTVSRNTQNGLPESVTGDSLNLGRSFNGYGEITGQTYSVNSQAIASWNLIRNNNGRITEKTETADGTTSHYAYTYDPLGRLRTVTRDGALIEEYRYDLNGTRNYEMNVLRNIMGRTFTYSEEDHLLTAGTATYQYNPDGFLATKTDGTDETLYDYSSRGELLGVRLPDGTIIDYIHDPLGRRIAKKVNGTITEQYLWQGLTRLLAVYDGSGNLKMRFEYGDSRIPYVMTKDGNIYYLTCDQVGSLSSVADSSGNVVKKVDYDSFGNIINDSNPAFAIPFGFAGGLFDTNTGLIRFGVRDYDPDIGRWTAKDPIFFNGGDTDLYGYCLSDPVNGVDTEGLWSLSIEGYYGFGGGFVFGKNPGGDFFLSFRYGYGIGGGLSFNPEGKSPGWDPCENYGPVNVGLGGYGGASVGLGPAYLGISGNVGVNVGGAGHVQPYAGVGPEYGLDKGWSLRGGLAVGGEITFF